MREFKCSKIYLKYKMSKYETLEIIEDDEPLIQSSNILNDKTDTIISINSLPIKKKRNVKPPVVLSKCNNPSNTLLEIGVDEAGRGPLFGRVYAAAVILPKDDTFDYSMVKDSKKFHSKKKIEEAYEYIKQKAIAWHVSYSDEKIIDDINILQATQLAMHNAIKSIIAKLSTGLNKNNEFEYNLLIDGNYFNPFSIFKKDSNRIYTIPHITVEGGDNTYASIAAASILAKVERDKYIDELCVQHPELSEHYAINSNKGYGAKKHIDGIKKHGITIWHRRSFAPCKNYV